MRAPPTALFFTRLLGLGLFGDLACTPVLGDAMSLGDPTGITETGSGGEPTGNTATDPGSTGEPCSEPGCATDDDDDGFSELDGDCADANPHVHPGASEVCDLLDNDCDGEPDGGLSCSGSIQTIAGIGKSPFMGADLPALDASLGIPVEVHVASNGVIYVAHAWLEPPSPGWGVARIDHTGILREIITSQAGCLPVEDIPALTGCIDWVTGLATDGDGNLYISARSQNVIWQVDTGGILRRFAGNGSDTRGGDGGPADAAGVPKPADLRLGPDGSLYVGDFDTNDRVRIRRIGTDGIITTFAGGGDASGEGIPALSADLGNFAPDALVFDGAGNLYMSRASDEGFLQKIDAQGKLWTIPNGFGAGGLAAENDGTLHLGMFDDGEGAGCGLYRLPAGGVRTPLTITGTCGFSGDGGPALGAEVYGAMLDRTPEGHLVLADAGNGRLRVIFQ